jgi:hypothetical protein
MFTKMATGTLAGLKTALKILVLVLLLIGGIRWAHDNPEQWQATTSNLAGTIVELLPKLVAAVARLITWALDGIVGMLPK